MHWVNKLKCRRQSPGQFCGDLQSDALMVSHSKILTSLGHKCAKSHYGKRQINTRTRTRHIHKNPSQLSSRFQAICRRAACVTRNTMLSTLPSANLYGRVWSFVSFLTQRQIFTVFTLLPVWSLTPLCLICPNGVTLLIWDENIEDWFQLSWKFMVIWYRGMFPVWHMTSMIDST